MPRYEYHCKACGRTVTLRLSVTQHEKTGQACPKCGSKKLTQLISSFLTQTSRKA
jgi:putative FmdB family regulatory protein